MMQKYAVKVNGDELYFDLSKKEAIKIAKEQSADSRKQVFVTWFRKSDGQHGYLNSDGNHAITGVAWES
jgi:hypothetical protein